jgi:hypothetical protein
MKPHSRENHTRSRMRPRYRLASFVIALLAIACVPARMSNAPRVVASGAWIGWDKTTDDSGFTVPGTLNGRPFNFVVDYGANTLLLADQMYDSLGLPHLYANARRVEVIVRKPGIAARVDSTADAVVQHNDTITEYWGDFEPRLVDSLRIGTSLQQHILLTTELSYVSLHVSAGLGRDILSQFDVELDGPGRTIRLYEPLAAAYSDTTKRRAPWLPRGLSATDCLPAVVVGPKPVPTLDPSDTAGQSPADQRKTLDLLVAVRRLLEQRELRFPVTLENHPFSATFDSGTRDAIINAAAAKLLGFTSANPRVRADPEDSTLFVSDADLHVGTRALAAPRLWIADTKFQGEPDYETTPMMLLGLAQFRNRVLFMSHSTGAICIGPAR